MHLWMLIGYCFEECFSSTYSRDFVLRNWWCLSTHKLFIDLWRLAGLDWDSKELATKTLNRIEQLFIEILFQTRNQINQSNMTTQALEWMRRNIHRFDYCLCQCIRGNSAYQIRRFEFRNLRFSCRVDPMQWRNWSYRWYSRKILRKSLFQERLSILRIILSQMIGWL